MHVVEFIHGLSAGGAEKALLRRLAYQPPDVVTTVVTTEAVPDRTAALLAERGAQVMHWPVTMWGGRHLHDFLENVGADVVVSHSPRESMTLLTWRTSIPTPLVVVAHSDLASDSPRWRRLKGLGQRWLNARADLHIAVSAPAADGPQCAGSRRIEIHLLGGEIHPTGDTVSAWPDGTKMRFMTLSRFVWFKNLVAFVDAVGDVAPAMRAAGAHVLVVGAGPLERDIANAIQRRHVSDVVSMHGAEPNPADLLVATDVLVNCSTLEGGPITLFEASLAGSRILSTPSGIAPVVLASDDASVLLTGSTPEHLAAGLLQALERGPVAEAERTQRALTGSRWESRVRAPLFYDLIRSAAVGYTSEVDPFEDDE